MNLFAKKKTATPVAAPVNPLDTISNLKQTLDQLEKRENHVNKRIDNALEEAKQKAAKKDKKGALFALKRKKMFETEVNKLQGSRITLEQQIMSLESASINITTFKAMQQGSRAMKDIRKGIDEDNVHDLMDELEEEKALQDAISDAISRPANDMFDDQELMDELAELEQLELDEQLQSAPTSVVEPSRTEVPNTVFSLPVAPSGPIQTNSSETEEERQLRELQASMLA